MKKKLSLLLVLVMTTVFVSACGNNDEPAATQTPEPQAAEANTPAPEPPAAEPTVPDVFLWDDFADRDPNNKPDTNSNGVNIWWDNWANLRASSENGVVQINFRPGEFDPEDYTDLDDYFARAADWMGNWGEAIDMWSMEGISYCKYLTIRMSGGSGGEENLLMLHFQPEDGPSFVKLFSELVDKNGENVKVTADMQDIVIDLQASGFPGMTNRMHIRSYAFCTINLDEIYFSEPIGLIDASSGESILAGFTVSEIGNPADLPIRDYYILLWDDFTDRDPNNKPELAPNGRSMWWDNWANLRASVTDGVAEINFRPSAFDPEDYVDEDDYYARAADWMGNWGEAIDMWGLSGIAVSKYLTIRMSGADGGEENKLILHFQPEDGPSYVKLFSDLVTKDGGNVEITTDMQDIVIDLEASGFPGMTNRMHIRSFAECTINLDTLYFSVPAGAIDTTDRDTILNSITVPELGNPADLPIRDYVAALR